MILDPVVDEEEVEMLDADTCEEEELEEVEEEEEEMLDDDTSEEEGLEEESSPESTLRLIPTLSNSVLGRGRPLGEWVERGK